MKGTLGVCILGALWKLGELKHVNLMLVLEERIYILFLRNMIADSFHYWQFAFQSSLHRDRKELMETIAYDLQQRSPWKSNNEHAMQPCHLCLSHKHHGMPVPIINQAGCTAFWMTGLVERIGRAAIKLYAHIQVPRGWIVPTLLMCHLLLLGGSNFQCTATR